MKIKCEKCGEEIAHPVSDKLEKYEVGQVICPKCGAVQRRYLSETDIMIYMTFTEILYFILTFITTLFYNYVGLNIITGIAFVIMLVGASIITGKFKEILYIKSIGRKDTMYNVLKEDKDKVSKSMRWQFLLFFAVVITFFTTENVYWVFVVLSTIVIAMNIFKIVLMLKRERNN